MTGRGMRAGTRQIKGPARATRGAALRRQQGWALTREAEEALFASADVLNEGQLRHGHDGRASYFGSLMVTFDLDATFRRLREPRTGPLTAELLAAVDGSVRVRLRAMRMACAEAARRVPELPLGTAQVETRVRLEGGVILLDVDFEVPFDVSSQRRQR